MVSVIGIKFQNNGKMYYFDDAGLNARMGDYVIVDTALGMDLGEVIMGRREIDDEQFPEPLKKVARIATAADIQHATENRAKEAEAYTICQKKIAEHNLEMKLVSVEYTFDNSKVLFYFTANGRVDFRALVKDLASVFKTRIELRQIGVRDEARMLGGLGPCGRQICCGAFLNEFQPVSIKMAKEQSLSLNPTKISGVCGRLMCCLKYEQDHYETTRKQMPRMGKEVITPEGNGFVTALNIVKETVTVRISRGDENIVKDFPMEQVSRIGEPRPAEQPEEEILPDDVGIAADGEFLDAEEARELAGLADAEPAAERKEKGEARNEKNRGNRPRNGKEFRNRDSRRGNRPDSDRKPGEPVRRVNPNRKDLPGGESARVEPKAPEAAPVKAPAPAPAATQKKTNSWADALEKAMRAADGNS